ncbi:MAG: sulfatase-like hydrolase/transferase [Muribaculaceae bacterium]|nr:sulfatase-like hydrolase/transferase [Muribaculaceae bacterium]
MKHFRNLIGLLKSKDIIFILSAIILFAADLMLFSFIIGDNSTFRLRTVLYLGDAALLSSIYWLCRPKFRWVVLPLIWIATLFIFANALFFRYWGDMFPLASMFNASNYNSFVFNSIPALLSPAIITIILLPTVITALYFILKPWQAKAFSRKIKITALVSIIAFYCLGIFLGVNSTLHWRQMTDHPIQSRSAIFMDRFDRITRQYDAWKHNGLFGYLTCLIANYSTVSSLSLTETERANISDYLKTQATHEPSPLIRNRGKNLVFIIVESLNSSVINVTDGEHRLTPLLSELVSSDSVISSTGMLSQIIDGGSSDGQLIYNTGLLPLMNGVAAMSFGENQFPSLAKALSPASSAEFIVETAAVYNHRTTSCAFGYDTLHDASSLQAAGLVSKDIGDDDAVLTYAFDQMLTMPQPFFTEITTLSMHFPFDIAGFEPAGWIDSLDVPDKTKRYYQTVHYTDAAIGRFLSRLKDSPLADNTIVVIASDHDCNPENIVDNDDMTVDFPILFIALGSGETLHYDGPMGQIDVFPTILDIMGVENSSNQWRGLGKSILSGGPTGAISRLRRISGNPDEEELMRLNRAFTISDTLIRSNYFAE